MNLFNTIIENTTAPTISSGFGNSPGVVAGTSTHAFSVNVGTVVRRPQVSSTWGAIQRLTFGHAPQLR